MHCGMKKSFLPCITLLVILATTFCSVDRPETNYCIARVLYTNSDTLKYKETANPSSRILAMIKESGQKFNEELPATNVLESPMLVNSALNSAEREYFIICEELIVTQYTLKINPKNMISVCKEISIKLNDSFKRLFVSNKIKKVFKVKLEEVLQALKVSSNIQQRMDDIISRQNEHLKFWLDKKRKDILDPIVNSFGKSLGIKWDVLMIIGLDTYDVNKSDDKCFDEVLSPNLINDNSIRGNIELGSPNLTKFIEKINRRCKSAIKDKIEKNSKDTYKENDKKTNEKPVIERPNVVYNEEPEANKYVPKKISLSKNNLEINTIPKPDKSFSIKISKKLAYLNEYCEIILESNISQKSYARNCKSYVSLIPKYFNPILKSKAFMFKFRNILLKVLDTGFPGDYNVKSNQQRIKRNLLKLKNQILNIINYIIPKKRLQKNYVSAVKQITLDLLPLLQIRFVQNNTLGDNSQQNIQPYVNHIMQLKEIIEKHKTEILRFYKKTTYKFLILIGIIKEEFTSKIKLIEKSAQRPVYIRLYQFYLQIAESSDNKYIIPHYRDSCEFLSKKTPFLFKKFYDVKGVKAILKSEFYHAFSMTKGIDLKSTSTHFYKVFQKLQIQQLVDFVRDFEQGYKVIRMQLNMFLSSNSKDQIDADLLRAILLSVYKRIQQTKNYTIDSLVKTLASYDFKNISFNNKTDFNALRKKLTDSMEYLSNSIQKGRSLRKKEEGFINLQKSTSRPRKLNLDLKEAANKILEKIKSDNNSTAGSESIDNSLFDEISQESLNKKNKLQQKEVNKRLIDSLESSQIGVRKLTLKSNSEKTDKKRDRNLQMTDMVDDEPFDSELQENSENDQEVNEARELSNFNRGKQRAKQQKYKNLHKFSKMRRTKFKKRRFVIKPILKKNLQTKKRILDKSKNTNNSQNNNFDSLSNNNQAQNNENTKNRLEQIKQVYSQDTGLESMSPKIVPINVQRPINNMDTLSNNQNTNNSIQNSNFNNPNLQNNQYSQNNRQDANYNGYQNNDSNTNYYQSKDLSNNNNYRQNSIQDNFVNNDSQKKPKRSRKNKQRNYNHNFNKKDSQERRARVRSNKKPKKLHKFMPPKPSALPNLSKPAPDSIDYEDPSYSSITFPNETSGYNNTPKIKMQMKNVKAYLTSMSFYIDLQKLINYSSILPDKIKTNLESCSIDLDTAVKKCNIFYKTKDCEKSSILMVTAPCPKGYQKIGIACYKNCPIGFRRYNDECQKPQSYFRKYFTTSKACRKERNGICEQYQNLYYEDCRPGYVEIFKVCVPRCPEGWIENGQTCRADDNFTVRNFSWNLGD